MSEDGGCRWMGFELNLWLQWIDTVWQHIYISTHTRSRCCVLWLPRGVSSNVALWWLLYASWSWTLFIRKRWAEARHQPPYPQLHLCRSSWQALMTSSTKCSKLRVPSYPGERWRHSCPSLETSSRFICLQPWKWLAHRRSESLTGAVMAKPSQSAPKPVHRKVMSHWRRNVSVCPLCSIVRSKCFKASLEP